MPRRRLTWSRDAACDSTSLEMGRPSKLTIEQWSEVTRRLAEGERAADLAKAYGVSKTAISNRVSKRAETVKAVANQLVAAEHELRSLPVSEQLLTLNLADKLRNISSHAASAAENGMMVAHRLTGISRLLVERIDDADPSGSMDDLKAVAAMGRIANDAAHIGLNLLAANKGQMALEQSKTAVPRTLADFYGENQ
jgi:hypothetical protein